MPIWVSYAVVLIGGGIGSVLRHGVNRWTMALLGPAFPWNTLFVNIVGSFAMGAIAGWFAFRGEASQTMRLFLTTGILGGFTTFSAFSLDAALLWERSQFGLVALYIIGSVGAALAGVFLGLTIMRTGAG